MIFLIEYDRGRGRLVRFEPFSDSDRKRAEESRLSLELELNLKGIENEVVLLEAANEESAPGWTKLRNKIDHSNA